MIGEKQVAWALHRSKVHARMALTSHSLWRVRGKLRGTDRTLSLLAAGPAGFEQQLAHVFLGEIETTERLADQPRIDRHREWRNQGDDVVAYVKRPWEQPDRDTSEMTLAVDARITLEGTTPENHATRHLAENHRRAWKRRNDLGVEYFYSSSPADLRFWYEQLHVPLIRMRHREHAYLPPLEEFEARRASTEIMFARKNRQVIAGVLLEHDSWLGTLTRTASGATVPVARNGKLYKILTIAMDYQGVERAHARHIPRFSLGFTLAQVNRGLFSYKRQWGASFVPDVWSLPAVVHLHPLRKCQILEQSPIITQTHDGTVVLVGATGDDDAALRALRERIKLSCFPNATRILVHATPEHAARIGKTIDALRMPNVSLQIVRGSIALA